MLAVQCLKHNLTSGLRLGSGVQIEVTCLAYYPDHGFFFHASVGLLRFVNTWLSFIPSGTTKIALVQNLQKEKVDKSKTMSLRQLHMPSSKKRNLLGSDGWFPYHSFWSLTFPDYSVIQTNCLEINSNIYIVSYSLIHWSSLYQSTQQLYTQAQVQT